MSLINSEWDNSSIDHLLKNQIDSSIEGEGASSFIETEEYCDALITAENEAMKIIMSKKSPLLPKAIVSLINKVDKRELHNHLTVFFCRPRFRRSLLSNWQLKRFLVDSNYILNHLGLEPLGFVDKSVRVSRKAMAIVGSLGPKVHVKKEVFSCENKKVEEVLNGLLGVIESNGSKESKKRKASLRIDKILKSNSRTLGFLKSNPERAEELKIKKIHVDKNVIENPLCDVPSKPYEVNAFKRKMDEVEVSEIKYTPVDDALKAECVESQKKHLKSKMFMDYKNALMKDTKRHLEEAVNDFRNLKEVVKNPGVLDETFGKGDWVPNEFENVKVFDFGLTEALDVGGPRLVIQAAAIYKEMKRSVEEDFKDYRNVSNVNYKNKREVELREEAAIKAQSLLKSSTKLYTFKRLLDKVSIKEYERIEVSNKIVESDFFKNESIRRSVIDLEHKRSNFNLFKLSRRRKHRIRSMLDVFFNTSTVPKARKMAYEDKSIPINEVEVYFTKGFDVIMGDLLRIKPDHLMYNDIEEHVDPVPYRKFTKRGVEIRHLSNIKYKKVLGCKRKNAPDWFPKKGKIKCDRYKGLPKCYIVERLNNWFEGIIDKLEAEVLKRDDKLLEEKAKLVNEMNSLKESIENLEPMEISKVENLESYYNEVESIINMGMKLYLTLEELSEKINSECKEKWLKSKVEQEEVVLTVKIEQLEMKDRYNEELAKLKKLHKNQGLKVLDSLPEINKLFARFENELDYDIALANKSAFNSSKDDIIREREGKVERAKMLSKLAEESKRDCSKKKNEFKSKIKKLKSKLNKVDDKYEIIRGNQEAHWETLKRKRRIVTMTAYENERIQMDKWLDKKNEREKINREKRKNLWMLRIKNLERQEKINEDKVKSWTIEEARVHYSENLESSKFMMFKSCLDKDLKVVFKIE